MRKVNGKDLNLIKGAPINLKACKYSKSTWLPDTSLGFTICSLEDFHCLFFAYYREISKCKKKFKMFILMKQKIKSKKIAK